MLQLKGHLQERAIGDDGSGLTVVDNEFQFRDGKPVVEIIEHHSRGGNADPTLQVPEAVLADRCDYIPCAQAEAPQASGESTHPAAPLRVSEACFSIDDRFSVRTRRHRARHWPR